MNKTIQATHFGKKTYAKPQIEAYEAKATNIVSTSGSTEAKPQSSTEQYQVVDLSKSWF